MSRVMASIVSSTAVALILGAGLASAADLPAATPVYQAPVASPDLWAGTYAGFYGGYKSGDVEGVDIDGVNLGGFVGYNWQANAFVYGIEADAGYSFADGSSGISSADQGLEGSLRGRLGYAFGSVLVYGHGGLAVAESDLKVTGFGSDDNYHIGYTVGVGAEALVTNNVFARLEYRYSDYQDESYNFGGVKNNIDFDEHNVRAGVGFKF